MNRKLLFIILAGLIGLSAFIWLCNLNWRIAICVAVITIYNNITIRLAVDARIKREKYKKEIPTAGPEKGANES